MAFETRFEIAWTIERLAFHVVENLSADGPQVGGLRIDWDPRTFALSSEIEEISDDVLNAVDAAFHHGRVLFRRAAGGGAVLKSAGGEKNRPKRIPDIVADDREDPLFEVPGKRQLLLAVLLRGILRFAALVDVYAASDESHEVPGVIETGSAAIEYPPVHAVATTEAIFHFERFSAVEAIAIVRYAALEIVGVHALGPAVPHLLLDGAPGERKPGLVEVVTLRVQSRAPDHHRRMLDEEAVLDRRQWPTPLFARLISHPL